jgi:hypothetical protein
LKAFKVKLKVPILEAFQLTREVINSSKKTYPGWVRDAYSARGKLLVGQWGERVKPTATADRALFVCTELGLIELPMNCYLLAKDGVIQGVCPRELFDRDFEIIEDKRIITI